VVTHHEKQEIHDRNGNVIDTSAKRLYGSKFLNAFFTKNYKLKLFNGIHRLVLGKDREGESMPEQEMKLVKPQYDLDSRLFFSIDETELNTSYMSVKKALKELKRCLPIDLYKKAGISKARFYQIKDQLIKSGEMLAEHDGKKIFYAHPDFRHVEE
jgi:hypothetical protein